MAPFYMLVTWIEVPVCGLSKRLLGTGIRACEACERLDRTPCLVNSNSVCLAWLRLRGACFFELDLR